MRKLPHPSESHLTLCPACLSGRYGLLHEFACVAFESFLALETAEVVGFAFVGNFELGCVFVEDCAADWVSEHILGSLPQKSVDSPPFMVSGLIKANHWGICVLVRPYFFNGGLCDGFDVVEVAHFAVAD